MRICDETPFGFGWIAPEPRPMERASHALRTPEGVYVIDPVAGDGVDARIRDLGEVAGVVQLLDRHDRDCRPMADTFGVPLHEVPFDGIPGSPFEVIPVLQTPLWREVALWWPQERVLVLADALGTASYMRSSDERIAVNPVLRAFPPHGLDGRGPDHILCGHGEGLHGPEAGDALHEALAGARRRAPQWLLEQARGLLGR